MIKIIDIPTEQTTAATDFIIFIQTVVLSILCYTDSLMHNYKGYLWSSVFTLICMISLFGVIAHGFQMTKKTNNILWQILTLLFASVYVIIFTALGYDLFGYSASLIFLAVSVGLGLILVFFCLRFPSFVPKIIYLGVGLGVLMLAGFLYLYFVVKMAGMLYMLIGIVLSFAAVIVEARQKFHVKLIWEFDHHSAYHFYQFLSNIAIFWGVKTFFLT